MSKSGISAKSVQTTLLEPRVLPKKPKSKSDNRLEAWLKSHIPLFYPHSGTHRR